MSELDDLFGEKPKKQPKRKIKLSAKIVFWLVRGGMRKLIGTFVVLLGVGMGFLAFLGFSDFEAAHNTIKDPNVAKAWNSALQYCEPNLRQRFGNGFDRDTCREKMNNVMAVLWKANNMGVEMADNSVAGKTWEQAVEEGVQMARTEASDAVKTALPAGTHIH